MSIMFKRSRAEALAAGDLFYETGKPCVNGHISKRYTRGSMCYSCLAMHREGKREEAVARAKRHTKANPESAKQRCLRWRAKNPHKVNAIEARRRAAKLRATPPWLTKAHLAQIEGVYLRAATLTAKTGVPHHVDHIIPLQGETACGLHVPWNLRALPAKDNLEKSNKVEVAL